MLKFLLKVLLLNTFCIYVAHTHEPIDSAKDEELLAPVLHGLVLMGDQNQIHKHGLERVTGFHIFDFSNPDEIEELRTLVELHYLNQPLKRKNLVKLKESLTRFFQKKKAKFNVVLVPG